MWAKELRRGLFITFEGGEGSGKTTHHNLLSQWLLEQGHPVLHTKEPGSPHSTVCQEIRSTLLKERSEPVHPLAELLMFFADRAQHIHTYMIPALERREIVLCDRFSDSTLAYQGTRGHSDAVLAGLTSMVQQSLQPDLILFFDPGEAVARERMGWRNKEEGNTETRIDNEAVEFHEQVWSRYRKVMASKKPGQVVTIDSSGSIEDTQARVREAFGGLLCVQEGAMV